MRTLIIAAAGALSFAAAAAAQPASREPSPAVPPAATPSAGQQGYTLDTPIETIAADPAGKAVLDKDLPGLTTHPAYDQFKGMSLKEVEPMSQGALTDDMLAKTATDLAALPK